MSTADLEAVSAQLGRPARGVRSVPYRCPDGHPGVVETEPALPDGTPFPTVFYLTCPVLTGVVSTLESQGLMRELTQRLQDAPDLAAAYARAHEHYLGVREAIAHVPQIAGISAGGMPDRVKCLHVLVAHSLATPAGTNPLGDLAIGALHAMGSGASCVSGLPDRGGDVPS